jgi:hypothetical protein
VDPRSAAAGPVDDPRGSLVRLAERSGRAFDTFASTRQRTRSELDRLARALEDAPLASGLSIVVFGSWAREELTPDSDDDWALVVAAEPFDADDAAIRAAVETAATVLGTEGKAPGAQAVFGVPFDARLLIERVGLDADTNTNLTRRLLLLLESREVSGDAHAECWKRVLSRYLDYGVKAYRPPRFLLNDLVRYWRTICRPRRQAGASRGRRPQVGLAQREAADLAQAAVRRRSRALVALPRTARRRDAALPRYLAERNTLCVDRECRADASRARLTPGQRGRGVTWRRPSAAPVPTTTRRVQRWVPCALGAVVVQYRAVQTLNTCISPKSRNM